MLHHMIRLHSFLRLNSIPLVVLVVKNLPASAGDRRDTDLIPGLGRSPGGSIATHSSILAWRIPWIEKPDRLQSIEWHSQTQLKQISTCMLRVSLHLQ